jgi:ElaB/YqjD/DUF883 family membrane-anchored ribosome-binding protein
MSHPSKTAKAKNMAEEQLAVLEEKGRTVIDTNNQRLEDRPYSTLGFALGIGFLLGTIFKGRR